MIEYKVFEFSPFNENTYVVWDSLSKEAVIIDPGCHSEAEKSLLKSFITDNHLTVNYLINTHCHIDHIFGDAFVKNTYDCIFLAPEKDVFLLENSIEQAKLFGIEIELPPQPDGFISEGTNITLGEITPQILFTPGHSPGEICIYFENDKLCFTGDVLFNMSIGRTDLWGGDLGILMKSITEKLLVLPDDVTILPGHGDSSTILFEKENNPFLSSSYS